jgi:1-deoxyxylulose-5-phosphate synthase
MDHARLGRSGLQVSRLCLGTMTFGLQSDEATGIAVMDKAADAGVDFFDTSDAYPLGGDLATRGRTEEIIGRWMTGKRDRFILATKCFAPTGPAPMDGGNSRRHIMSAVEASLRRLNTDYLDLYQLHGYDKNTPIDETLSTLDDLVHAGKVRYVGCSNFLTYQIVRAVGRCFPASTSGPLPRPRAAGSRSATPGPCTRSGTGMSGCSTPWKRCASWPTRPPCRW